METTPELRIIGNDGKSYPLFRPTSEEVAVLIDASHRLRHEWGFSVAQIGQWLAERGVPRAQGSIYRYLAEYPCEDCPSRATVDRQRLAV